jgi:thiamine biosynthesis lipoprotein
MKSHSDIDVRRARPLLGTIVDLNCRARDPDTLERGIEAAFAAVAQVHQLMSFHDPESDISRINRDAFQKPVRVDPWTFRVLKAAQRFSRESGGIFDITVAPTLSQWNYLPRNRQAIDAAATWRDISLRKDRRVRFRQRLLVDLGGIAKGFAVDRAVDALVRSGVRSGIVNAGGDLRVFGSAAQQIHLRHPAQPVAVAGAIQLRNRALATSAVYFTQRRWRGRKVSPLIHGGSRRPITDMTSVSVAAPDCMTADALTKVVFALRDQAAPLLALHRAGALLLERNGASAGCFQTECESTRLD